MGNVRHNCGFCVAHSLHDTYNFLRSLQNRGREAAGIAAVGENRIDVIKWVGKVETFTLEALHELLDGSSPIFLGHVRYATKGRKDIEQILQDAHPIAIGGETTRRDNHIIIRDCRIVGVHNGHVEKEYFGDIGPGDLRTGTDTEKLLMLYDQVKEKELLKRVPGAYTMAIADKANRDVLVIRDRTGIRPGVLGWKDGKFVVVSENNALRDNKAEFREELEPGSVYYMSDNGRKAEPINVVEPSLRQCHFEWQYIAHVNSILSQVPVEVLRRNLGDKLAEELADRIDLDTVDYVTYLPRCPKPAAIQLAKRLGIPFLPVFYKQNLERSFQGPDEVERKESIKENLFLIDRIEDKIRGKRILVVDDSTVRGNNSRHAANLLNHTAWVDGSSCLVNYTPEIGIVPADGVPRGCMFGVDMPPEEAGSHRFIARGRSPGQISQEVGMETLYISEKGMLEVYAELGIPAAELCTYCIGGQHPFEEPHKELEEMTQVSVGST